MRLLTFEHYLRYEKRYSEHTVLAYMTDLRQFEGYLKDQYDCKNLAAASSQMIRSWLVQHMQAGMAERSIRRKLSTLKSLYKYMRVHGHVEMNPARAILPPKLPKRLPTFVSEGAMNNLFDGIEYGADFAGVRDRLVIELLYTLGLRRAELIGLEESHIQFERKQILVFGKRRKQRLLPLLPQTEKIILNYLNLKKDKFGETKNMQLLVTDKGSILYPMFVYRKVKRYLEIVATQTNLSPHVLRHTFATHLLQRGADLQMVKELLGHSSLAATQVYTHTNIEQLKSLYKSAHPRGGSDS